MTDGYDEIKMIKTIEATEALEGRGRTYTEAQIRAGVSAAAAAAGWTPAQTAAIRDELVEVAECYASEGGLVSDHGLLALIDDFDQRGLAQYQQMLPILG